MGHQRENGVSVVICSYNGAQRIPATLRHLAEQDAPGELPWEVVVVDNASTDGTAERAQVVWSDQSTVPLRLVSEPRPGLMHARERGLHESTYNVVTFVDDDNWV